MPRHFPDDDYHPHYPTPATSMFVADAFEYADYAKMANPYRLMCCRYTPEQEESLALYWKSKQVSR